MSIQAVAVKCAAFELKKSSAESERAFSADCDAIIARASASDRAAPNAESAVSLAWLPMNIFWL